MQEFEENYRKYQEISKKKTNENTERRQGHQTRFEDITEERYQWGTVAEVYRTAENAHQQRLKKTRYGDVALILRRIIPNDRNSAMESKCQLEIQSDTLRAAFRDIATGIVNINLHQDTIIIPEPYVELFHCHERIVKAIEHASNDILKNELQLLWTFRTEYMLQTVEIFYSLENQGFTTFEFIRNIFVPGELVLIPNRLISPYTYWAAVLAQCHIIEDRGEKLWEVTLVYTTFDGNDFGKVFAKLRYPEFGDVRRIDELPVYPLKYHPERQELVQSLTERGSKYKRLCIDSGSFKAQGAHSHMGSHWHYEGAFWELTKDDMRLTKEDMKLRIAETESTPTLTNFNESPFAEGSGRIIVDPLGFVDEVPYFRDVVRHDNSGPSSVLREPYSHPLTPQLNHRLRKAHDVTKNAVLSKSLHHVTDMQLLTMPPIVPAFSLSKQDWGFYLVNGIREISWDKYLFDSLQMDGKRKDLIRSLVDEHRNGRSSFDDFISGKGKGLVFLLDGPPGSGKTMTAETVADSLRCPLYYTTGGELGSSVEDIEKKIRLIFQRIERWGAILLFDEADTFMAKRTEESIERNALMSILLRVLEYQSGILFLTTNRAFAFDPAFYSRIHARLEFQPSNSQQRTSIWARLAESIDHKISPEQFEQLGKLPLDGRRIKNVLKMASLLMQSRDDGVPMTFEDVKDSLQISAGDPNDSETEKAIGEFGT